MVPSVLVLKIFKVETFQERENEVSAKLKSFR